LIQIHTIQESKGKEENRKRLDLWTDGAFLPE
jgi:hypothetical protein